MMPVRELQPGEDVVPFEPLPPDQEKVITVRPRSENPVVRELRPDEVVLEETEFGPFESFGRGSNVGIAEGLGAPVDLVNYLVGLTGIPVSEEPFLGSRQIRRGFAALGIAPPPGQDDPDSITGSAGRVVGAAATFLLPAGGASGLARGVSAGTRPAATSVTGRMVEDIGGAALETPGRFVAGEMTAAAAAGTGGFIARDRYPDSEAASVIGEIIGGLSPAGGVLALKGAMRLPGMRLARRMVRPFTKTGGRKRAEARVEESARDIESAKRELDKDVLPEAELTPAQKTGDEGLLSLERAVIESSEQLKGQSDEQIARATQAIRESMEELGEGVSPEKTAETLQQARAYVLSLVETRARIAARRADERIAELSPTATREDANLIVRDELEKALADIRAQEREIWEAVPKELEVSTKTATDRFAEIVSNTPKAQQEDIPDIARRFLDAKSNTRFKEAETVAELQGLRSKLLEEARKARADGKFNTARIADELAEAVLEDLGAQRDNVTGEAGEALRQALDFSADLNERFTKGTVGRLLGTDKRGGATVPGALTLETTVARAGPRAKVEAAAIMRAADTPELRGAVEDFILDDFERRAVRNGKIDAKKADAFLARNIDILDDFPELRTRIEVAMEAGETASLRGAQAEGLAKRLSDPKISRAAVFLQEPVENAIQRVIRSPRPDKTMRELVKQARRDPTGDAVKGLKTALGGFLLESASTRTFTAAGDAIVSGRKLKQMLGQGPIARAAKALLSPEEYRRLVDIADVAEKVEKAMAATATRGGIIEDTPSVLFATAARITGAQVGRQVATATGGGTVQTPGILSGVFKNAVTARVQDPARRLLVDAMGSQNLFEALLLKETPKNARVIRRRLNAWLLSIGAEQIPEDSE